MDAKDIKNVLIVGAGTMGSQISLDCAQAGYNVTVWDSDERALASMGDRHNMWAEWQTEKGQSTREAIDKALGEIRKETDARAACADADLLIEAVFEQVEIKSQVFARFEEICPEKTVFVTNTSTLMPRDMEAGIVRKARFSAFHFNWPKTVIEIMRGSATSDETVKLLQDFARSIGYLPILIQKEYPGYVHAALFAAWAITGVQLAALGVATIPDIDRTWMRGDDAPLGPLSALDSVGIDLVMMILQNMKAAGVPGFQYEAMMDFLQPYIDRGDLGMKTGKGFYEYPNPEFKGPDFLK
jgi:3-hydroxybutyryl-CoA dehydrogenase